MIANLAPAAEAFNDFVVKEQSFFFVFIKINGNKFVNYPSLLYLF